MLKILWLFVGHDNQTFSFTAAGSKGHSEKRLSHRGNT